MIVNSASKALLDKINNVTKVKTKERLESQGWMIDINKCKTMEIAGEKHTM